MSIDLLQGMPVLVTGGAGFIGSHLTRKLVEVGANVMVMDNLSNGSMDNLRGLEQKIGILTGDIRSAEDCARAMKDRVAVFHLAALGSVPKSVEQPLLYNEVNITGTLTVLEAARKAGVRRVVYSASSAAYGDTPVLPKVETMTPSPKSPYAVTKLVGEYYCRVFSEVYNLSTVSLRYFNVFGPRQNPNSQYAAVIPAFVSSLLKGVPPKIYGDGEQTRDFCFVNNVVKANMLAATAERPLKGETVNIACGQRTSLNAMLAQMQRVLGTNVKPEYLAPRAGDVRDSLADVSAAKALIGYTAEVLFDQGLEVTVKAYAGR
ncbi:MAG TPA: SDR family oxidoreductase [Phycisphaerae bacterium]|nr:SDR family oxidoreductase [Phycisphaerae bacterium]